MLGGTLDGSNARAHRLNISATALGAARIDG